jgi:hypothetical protein
VLIYCDASASSSFILFTNDLLSQNNMIFFAFVSHKFWFVSACDSVRSPASIPYASDLYELSYQFGLYILPQFMTAGEALLDITTPKVPCDS